MFPLPHRNINIYLLTDFPARVVFFMNLIFLFSVIINHLLTWECRFRYQTLHSGLHVVRFDIYDGRSTTACRTVNQILSSILSSAKHYQSDTRHVAPGSQRFWSRLMYIYFLSWKITVGIVTSAIYKYLPKSVTTNNSCIYIVLVVCIICVDPCPLTSPIPYVSDMQTTFTTTWYAISFPIDALLFFTGISVAFLGSNSKRRVVTLATSAYHQSLSVSRRE